MYPHLLRMAGIEAQKHRSTSDIVWTHRWYAAKTALLEIDIHITGIDMSSAFDTIDRKLLLNILKDILDEDEMSFVSFYSVIPTYPLK